MRPRVLIASANGQVSESVRAMSTETDSLTVVATTSNSADTIDVLRRTDVDVLLLDAELGPLSVVELARSIGVSFPFVGIVLIAASRSPDLLRAAIDCGARGVLNLPLAFEELEAAVGAAGDWAEGVREYAANPRLSSMPTRGATVVAVAGGKGGAGTSTVALHLGLAVAQHAQRRKRRRLVCVADFSETGDARLRLDVYSRRDALDLAQVSQELSVRHLEEALYVHRSGLRVLLGPEQAELRDEIDAAATRAIVGALAASHELVILDLGVGISPSALAALELADEAIIVTTPDVVSIRASNRLAELWERASGQSADVQLLINRQSRRSEIQPDLLARAASVRVAETHVPANFRGFEASLNSGTPEALTDQGLARAFVSLADEIDVLEDPAHEREQAEAAAVAAMEGGDGRWWRRARPESGYAEAEVVGGVLILGLMMLVVIQFLLAGATFLVTDHAAQRGARAWAVGEDFEARAKADLPGLWRDGADVDALRNTVTVDVPVPSVLGFDLPLRFSAVGEAVSERGVTTQVGR